MEIVDGKKKKKEKEKQEFRLQSKCVVSSNVIRILLLEDDYGFVDYVNWISPRTRYKTDKHIFQLACTVKMKPLSSKW